MTNRESTMSESNTFVAFTFIEFILLLGDGRACTKSQVAELDSCAVLQVVHASISTPSQFFWHSVICWFIIPPHLHHFMSTWRLGKKQSSQRSNL